MKINFYLNWVKPGKPPHKAFKDPALCRSLYAYVKKVVPFCRCDVTGIVPERKPGTRIWFCDKNGAKKPASSEDLAAALKTEMNSGTKELMIIIGGADGLGEKEYREYKPDFIWSFGPLTLPHELASVVAAEQLYRGFTILNGHPYHHAH